MARVPQQFLFLNLRSAVARKQAIPETDRFAASQTKASLPSEKRWGHYALRRVACVVVWLSVAAFFWGIFKVMGSVESLGGNAR